MKALALALGLLAVGIAPALATGNPPEKVTICHAAGLAEEPANWITLTLPWVAVYGQAGHFYENGTPAAGHEQDYLGACTTPTSPPPTSPPTSPPPTSPPTSPPPTSPPPTYPPSPTTTPTPTHSETTQPPKSPWTPTWTPTGPTTPPDGPDLADTGFSALGGAAASLGLLLSGLFALRKARQEDR